MKTVLNTAFAVTAAALAMAATPAKADFSFGACNIQGASGLEPVLIVNLPGGQKVIRKGDRGLDHTHMFGGYLGEMWIRAAFPTETEGEDARHGVFCGGTKDIDAMNDASKIAPTPPTTTETDTEFETTSFERTYLE